MLSGGLELPGRSKLRRDVVWIAIVAVYINITFLLSLCGGTDPVRVVHTIQPWKSCMPQSGTHTRSISVQSMTALAGSRAKSRVVQNCRSCVR